MNNLSNEVDFVVPHDDLENYSNIELEDEPNFSFDDSTFYKLVWANYVPAVSSSKENIDTEVKIYDKSDKERKHELYDELVLTSPNNEKYRCLIPILNKPKEKINEEEEKGLSTNPYTVLKSLFKQKYCSYRVETFWTYEICHGHYIRQYHEDLRNQDNNQEYFLGKFNSADLEKYENDYEMNGRSKKLPTVNVFDFSMPYISVNMSEGTLCDLSQKKRDAKVLYVCVEDSLHDLYSIKETSTCEYEVVTFSSLLCDVPEFRMKISHENDIKCYPMNDSPPVPTGFEIIPKSPKPQIDKVRKTEQSNSQPNWVTINRAILTPTNDPSKPFELRIVTPTNDDRKRIQRDFLRGEYCLVGGFQGWWRHEFCYGKSVVQFHEKTQSEEEVDIILGKWNLEKHIQWLEKNPSKKVTFDSGKPRKQVSHYYSGGQICGNDKKMRSVEVKIKCIESNENAQSPDAVTISLEEPTICEYILTVESRMFCELMQNVDEYGLFKSNSLPVEN